MMNNYQCTGCGVVISADSELTPTVQCTACSSILNLGKSVSAGEQSSSSASTYMDYQCPGCGSSNSADPVSTPEVRCNTCMMLIKLGHAEPKPQPLQQEAQSPPAPSIPEMGDAAKTELPGPAIGDKSDIPQLGSAAKNSLPQLGGAIKKELPQLGSAVKKDLPELGGTFKKELPQADAAAIKDEFSGSGGASENKAPVSESAELGTSEAELEESQAEETIIQLSDSVADQREEKVRPAWVKFLLQPRVLIVLLGVAPVMITVVVGAILAFIRCGTGIANGEDDLLIQGAQIVMGLASLWAMYILGMTFYYADRDWVTDFGHFAMIGGGIWGIYAVATSFPSTFLAIMSHLFFGYVAVAAIALAVWLLAPYKGIGSPR